MLFCFAAITAIVLLLHSLMRNIFPLLLFLFPLFSTGQHHITQFETSGGKESPTYADIINWWKTLDESSPVIAMKEMGPTDAGFPLHLVIVSADGKTDIASLQAAQKNIILINNGIHPGEPDGIDASMLLVRDIVQGKYKLPSSIALAIIPVYNIGGALNRSRNFRIDQAGPTEKGFRGNAQNLDLNRDFIKMDSKNAMSFAKIFTQLDPDVFVDNHVSNGADYQHVMTLLVSQHNKLGGAMGQFMNQTFEPSLYPMMKNKGFDLIPYVNHFGETPDKGWPEFFDSPRYGSGYGTLWNTFSFVPETHMLKPYPQRVAATRALMESFIEFTAVHGKKMKELREQTRQTQAAQTVFPIAWKWDRTKSTDISFKGYEAGYKPSEVSGLSRLFYDRGRPYEKKIPFYNNYVDTLGVQKPSAYIIPQGWWKVIERLQANGIVMRRLQQDTTLQVETYRIAAYQSGARPYEGHHPNRGVQIEKSYQEISFRKGDYFISTDQKGVRFLIEVLEPQAEDSYFAWNFFDPILGQKEGFSPYVFEETAAEFLRTHPEVKQQLEERKKSDEAFAKSAQAQLDFVYRHSPYYEPGHNLYPVFRLM
jgi:hypothetical protein